MFVADIQCLGSTVCLIPCATVPDESSIEHILSRAECALLMPSLAADARVVPILRHRGSAAPAAIHLRMSLAAAIFLRRGRGLPLDEIDVEYENGIHTVHFEPHSPNPWIKIPECKQMLSNNRETVNNADIFSTVYTTSIGKIKLVRCEDASLFSGDAMRTLLHQEGGFNLSCVAVYSVGASGVVNVSVESPIYNDADVLPFVSSAIGRELHPSGPLPLCVRLDGKYSLLVDHTSIPHRLVCTDGLCSVVRL